SVQDGMTIAIGGFINAAHPMLVVRGLIRRKFHNLTIVGAASAGLEMDLLIAAGCAAKVATPYISGEKLAPIGPAFRAAAEAGKISVKEIDDPISGEKLLAIPALNIDVAFLHAAVSDRYGNVQHNGHGYGDRAIA